MKTQENEIGRWYRCPYCSNYSIFPEKCCGNNMIEVIGMVDQDIENKKKINPVLRQILNYN
jgi:hypothetical protein